MRPRQVSDEAILEAARNCLLRDGPGVAIARIAEEVGISAPAVLKRFGTKEQLVTRALLSEAPPNLSPGPDPGPLRPQLVAIMLKIEPLVMNAVPRLATSRARGIQGSQWLAKPHPSMARRNLLAWLMKACASHQLRHPDLEAAANLLVSLVEARGFLAWVDPAWVKPGRAWAARAVDAIFPDLQLEPRTARARRSSAQRRNSV